MGTPNAIAAYLFYIWDTGIDSNRELTPTEVGYYHQLASQFIDAAKDLLVNLEFLPDDTEEEIQYYLYEVGKKYFGTDKKELLLWFKCLYTVFFGYSSGPRIGTFIHIYGIEGFLIKLEDRLNNPFGFNIRKT